MPILNPPNLANYVLSTDPRLDGLVAADASSAASLGDGRHGIVSLAAGGASVISGLIGWDSGLSRYYLLDDLQAYDLILAANVTLEARGFRVYVFNETDTSAGGCVISADGRNASGITGGAGHPPASATGAMNAGGGNGANGTNVTATSTAGTTNSVPSTTVRLAQAPTNNSGAARRDGTTSSGASPTAGTAWVNYTHGPRKTPITGASLTYGGSLRGLGGLGGCAGAARAAAVTIQRGAGGGGAGCVFFSTRFYKGHSTSKITANGGNGSSGTAATDDSSGGGSGGEGGYICVNVGEVTSGTLVLEAKGGAGGNGAAVLGTAVFRDGGGGGGGNGGYIEYFVGAGTVTTDVSGGVGGAGVTTGTGGTATDGVAGLSGTVVAAPVIV